MASKKTLQEVKEILKVKNPNIKILDDVYINNATKMKCLCKIHNYEFYTAWGQLQGGHGCPICGKSMPLTMDIVKERLSKINNNIEILDKEYVNLHHKMKCKCKIDGYEWMVHAGNLLHNNRGCPRCSGNERFTNERALEILEKKCDNIIFKDFKYKNNTTKIPCECKICGYEWNPTFASLSAGSGCPVCANKQIMLGRNDISTTRPDLVKYFKNKDDSTKYVEGSNLMVDMVCPECGTERNFRISDLSYKKFTCNACSDGITMPNKMLYNTLLQSNLKFEIEKSIDGTKRRYDAVIYSKNNFVIECHGKQHYEEWGIGKSLKYEKENDKLKKEIAGNMGYKYIEIDCRKSNLDFIKNNIIKELSFLIDFSNYDWDFIYAKSMSSLVVECSILKNNNPELTTTQIGNILSLSKGTVRNYLITASKLNLCEYNGQKEALRIIELNKGRSGKTGRPVIQINNSGEIIKEYKSVKELLELNPNYTTTMYRRARFGEEFDGFIWKYK